jgi:hypothetical protein
MGLEMSDNGNMSKSMSNDVKNELLEKPKHDQYELIRKNSKQKEHSKENLKN